ARHNHDAQGVKVGFFSGSAQVENSDETVVMIEDRGCRTGHIVSLFEVVFAANDLNRLTMPEGKSDRPCSRLFFPPHPTGSQVSLHAGVSQLSTRQHFQNHTVTVGGQR